MDFPASRGLRRRRLLGCGLFAFAFISTLAGPLDDALVAAMRLSASPNYSWVATVTDDARTYDISGQTSSEGFSRVRMPAINTLRRRLARSVTDTEVEFIFRGNVDWVVATEQGWLRAEELPPAQAEEKTGTPPRPNSGANSTSSGLPGSLPGEPEGRARNYSNLQLGLSRPHEELGIIVSSHREITVTGSVVTGALTERGAQLLLVRDGHPEITPQQARGDFTLWLQGGVVIRYRVQLAGRLEITTTGTRRLVDVNQTTDTRLHAIGTTPIDIPEPARLKLAR